MIQRQQPERVILQIKPDKSVRNHRTEEIAKLISSFYRVPSERWRMDGGRLVIRTVEKVSFRIVFEKGEVCFYLDIPRDRLSAIQRRLESIWEKATVLEVEALPYLTPNITAAAEVHYSKHDMFSLRTDHRDNLPLPSLLAPARDLQDGDIAVVDVLFEPISRVQWEHDMRQAHEQLRSGRMPVRGTPALQKGFEWFNAGMNFMRYSALELTAFTKEQEAAVRRMKRKEQSDSLATRIYEELSAETRRKHTSEALAVSLRAVVQSSDAARREQALGNICAAWHDLDADNELTNSRARDAAAMLYDIEHQRHARHVMRLSTGEAGKVLQLPGAELLETYPEVSGVRRTEAALSNCFTDQNGIYAGTAIYKGTEHTVHIPAANADMLMTARAFMGSPRQGKDQAIINLIVESKRRHGIGAVIPDWIDERKIDADGNQRGMADAVRDSLPAEDVIDIDWSNFDHIVPLGLSSIATSTNARIAADRIAKELTAFLMGDDIGHHTTREYLRDAAKACAGDLLDIKKLFTDSEFRREKIEQIESTGIGDADMWLRYDEDMSDARRAQIFEPVNVRLCDILNDEVLSPIFCQRPNPAADIRRWISEGKVVILRIPTREMSEMSVKILAYYVVMTTFLIKLSMNGTGPGTWVVINEPHQVETPGFVHFMNRIMAEGPKYRIAPLFAFHHLGQLSKEFADMLVSSSLSWHLFYNSNMQMYERLRSQIEPFTPDQAMKQTPRFHFIAAGWRDATGMMQTAFMAKAPELVKKRWGSQDNSDLTNEHAQLYGKPIEEVLSDIKQRSRSARRRR